MILGARRGDGSVEGTANSTGERSGLGAVRPRPLPLYRRSLHSGSRTLRRFNVADLSFPCAPFVGGMKHLRKPSALPATTRHTPTGKKGRQPLVHPAQSDFAAAEHRRDLEHQAAMYRLVRQARHHNAATGRTLHIRVQ